jgi:hypothetical protein
MLTLCEVAALARDIEAESTRPDSVRRVASMSQFGISREDYDGMLRYSSDDDSAGTGSKNAKSVISSLRGDFIVDPKAADTQGGNLDSSQRAKMNELLGAW